MNFGPSLSPRMAVASCRNAFPFLARIFQVVTGRKNCGSFSPATSSSRAWIGDSELRAEIDYLVEKGLAKPEAKRISPENKQWTITAEGRDFLATEGLA